MANTYLSTCVQLMLDWINTSREILEVFRGQTFSALLRRLKAVLLTANGVLADAEEKEDEVREIKHWLTELKDAFFLAEDILDEISAEALRRRVESDEGSFADRIRNLMASSDYKMMEQKMEEIVRRLEHVVKHREVIGLREYSELVVPFRRQQPQTIPNLPEFRVVGRDGDKLAIVNVLLSDDVIGHGDLRVSVIPIVGMPGVGKTAFTQAVYNDDRVSEHFDLKAWICVGEYFDVLRVTKAVLQEITSAPVNIEDLPSLQVELKNRLRGKKIFFVLDNVWCENYSEWESFLTAFLDGVKGSKIVVTTRSEISASITQTVQIYHLKLLADEDCWEMISRLALGNIPVGSLRAQLEGIGKNIAKQCNGLPLAAKAVASQLCSKPTAQEWHDVLRNFPHYTSSILPDLKLSYDSLSSHLKRGFAFCSIFPKGYIFYREKLVLLWMAVDLLQQPRSNKRLEDIGHEYLDDLIARSLLQPLDASKSCFVMHDLMNDLAKSVSGDFCFRLENNGTSQIPSKVRHLSFSGSECDASRIFESLHGAKLLRTILKFDMPPDLESLQLTDRILQDLLLALKRLRVLCLSHYHITNLPESFRGLKLLRYLDLSNTAIRNLPDSICTHYNLQTLLLSSCGNLTKLPANMGRLINLRYLDLLGTPLKKMPIGIKKLKNLQMLSNFFIGKSSAGAGLYELKELVYLRGTLHISELQNVAFASEASEAGLKKKQFLDGLALKWNVKASKFFPGRVHTLSCDQTAVLEMLEPHPNLKRLTVEFYEGASFPNWLGDPSFSKIVFVRLSSCKFCLSLPPLGQLPSLKDLAIEKFERLQKVGPEFFNEKNDPPVKPFQSLETLTFSGMPRWEEWDFPEIVGCTFPCLQKLSIQRCPRLIRNFPRNLPSFTEVSISECPLKRDDGGEDSSPTVPVGTTQNHPDSSDSMSSHEEFLVSENQIINEISSNQSNEEADAFAEPSLPKESQTPVDAEMPSRTEDEISSQHSEQRTEISQMSYRFLDSSAQLTEEVLSLVGKQPLQSYRLRTDIPSTSYGSGTPETRAPYKFLDPSTELPSLSYGAGHTIKIGHAQDQIESDFESLKVSETSQLMELQQGLRSLKIEGCEGLISLPEGLMGRSPHLQELFIVECSSLESFPGGHPPTALKTLHVRNCNKLEIIQPLKTMHQYSQLEYLFIGSSCDTLLSFPLTFFPKLKSLSIRDCVNFNSISVLDGLGEERMALGALEVRDCPNLVCFPEGGLPTPKLTSMLLSNCKSLMALPQMLFKLSSLQSLFINECPEIETVPEGGFPLSLSTVCITNCHKLTLREEWGLCDLDNLHNLEIEGGCDDLESFPEEGLLPRSLYSLRISGFLNLKTLDYKGLQKLSSLEMLEITGCDKLLSFPDEGLPSSLSYLCINDCPSIKEKLLQKEMEWYKLLQILQLEIDGEVLL